MSDVPATMRLPEAADRLGISDKTLRRWAKAGYANLVTVGPTKRLRITADEVDRLAALMEPRPVAS